jgi:16S rRNA G527 N7-methylase RsmG
VHQYKENKLEFLEFKEKLALSLSENKVSFEVTDDKAQRLFDLTKIMLEVSKVMNLTAISD